MLDFAAAEVIFAAELYIEFLFWLNVADPGVWEVEVPLLPVIKTPYSLLPKKSILPFIIDGIWWEVAP